MDRRKTDFEREAARAGRRGFLVELWQFLRASRKWWLVPIIVTLLLVAVLVYISGSAAAPFVYTLF